MESEKENILEKKTLKLTSLYAEDNSLSETVSVNSQVAFRDPSCFEGYKRQNLQSAKNNEALATLGDPPYKIIGIYEKGTETYLTIQGNKKETMDVPTGFLKRFEE